jgi:hypothetical protein
MDLLLADEDGEENNPEPRLESACALFLKASRRKESPHRIHSQTSAARTNTAITHQNQ